MRAGGRHRCWKDCAPYLYGPGFWEELAAGFERKFGRGRLSEAFAKTRLAKVRTHAPTRRVCSGDDGDLASLQLNSNDIDRRFGGGTGEIGDRHAWEVGFGSWTMRTPLRQFERAT